MNTPARWLRKVSKYFSSSISNKIIIPYALLTLILAVFGIFVVTQLVAGSFEERLKNQLADAGRIVSDEVVNRERLRLEAERAVANTIGVPEALVDRNLQRLDDLISPLIANNKNIDSIIVVDTQGKEVLRLQRETVAPNGLVQTRTGSGASYFAWSAVSQVLSDPTGEIKQIQLARDAEINELIIYTVGPVRTSEGVVGAVLVGTYLKKEINVLRGLALADLTLFDETGKVVASTLVSDQAEAAEVFKAFTPQRFQQIVAQAEKVVFLDEIERPGEADSRGDIEARGQTFRVAYAPFILRGRVYGVYAVALPTNFITNTNIQSRNLLGLIFSIGVVAVLAIGILVSRRIIRPIIRLVTTSQAIAKGDLDQKTGLKRDDEIGILASAFDKMTSELRRLLKIQEEEASKLNAILQSIADGVIVLDFNGDILTMNPAAEKILEAVAQESLAAQNPETDDAEGEKGGGSRSAQLLSRLTNLEFHEAQRFDMEEQRLFLSALSAPVITSNEQQLGSVVVLRDISREVESDKLKDNFIKSVSHELKTPLTAIKGYSDLLRMIYASKPDEREAEFIGAIDDNVGDLLNIIQQVLDLSQIDAGELGIDQEPVNLRDLVVEEAEKWAEKMEEKELSFSVHLPDEPVWVEGDWSRLAQVVHNLLSNANRYTLPGGGVEISLKQENGRGRIEVKDTGVGISREDQRFLFTRFFRAIHEESTYEVSGAGLGLHISKAIVEAHNGEMWFESELNRGSAFSFAIPVIHAEPGNLAQEEFEPIKTQE